MYTHVMYTYLNNVLKLSEYCHVFNNVQSFKSDFLRKPADLVLGFYEIGS